MLSFLKFTPVTSTSDAKEQGKVRWRPMSPMQIPVRIDPAENILEDTEVLT
jgi:hypothetical protein